MSAYEDRESISAGRNRQDLQPRLRSGETEEVGGVAEASAVARSSCRGLRSGGEAAEGGSEGAGRRDRHRRTLLYAGVEGGNEHIVAALLGSGGAGDLKLACGDFRHTPLHHAVVRGKRSVAQVLVLAGADVNVPDAWNNRPLHIAIRRGHEELARDLLLNGTDPNTSGAKGHRPVDLAAHLGHDGMVLDLWRRGADLGPN